MEQTFLGDNTRPKRVGTDVKKDESYHLKNGRWCIYHGNNDKRNEHLRNIETNINFYSPNKQWMEKEDVSSFLMDGMGETTSRIKAEFNYVQIMANQNIGNVCRMGVNASAVSFSPMVKERKEEKLQEYLMWTDIAAMSSPDVKNTIQANMPVGNSEMETMNMFGNYYTDELVKGINSLLKYSSRVNNIDLLKREVAEDLVLKGMAIIKPEVVSNEYRWRWIKAENFIFDREAYKLDLSDAAYMGEVEDVLLSELYERTDGLNRTRIEQLEKFTSQGYGTVHKPDRLKIYKMYWRDVREEDWGYVKNEFDDIVLEKINYTDDYIEEAKYKDSDVISIKDLTPHQLKVVGKKRGDKGSGRKKIFTDEWRYVEFVPAEYFMAISNRKDKNLTSDMVLDYGVMPFQEYNTYSPFNMETPYKVGTYIYIDGCIYSPIDITINPQRIGNRIISVVENLLSNAGGSNIIFAEEAIEKSKYTEEELSVKVKKGEAISLRAMPFGGIQNTVWKYDGTNTQSAAGLMEIANGFLQMIEKITGVNEAMKGQMEQPDQLVGTMKLMIQKGTVVTERYYTAIRELFRQCFQATAESGKRFYINEKPKLVGLVGEKEAEALELTSDYMHEHFRVSVDLVADEQSDRQYVDTMLFQLMQIGLIDEGRLSMLVGRGGSEDMWYAVREFVKEKNEMQKIAAEQEQAQAQQIQAQEQENVDRAYQSQQAERDTKLAGDMMKALNTEQSAGQEM